MGPNKEFQVGFVTTSIKMVSKWLTSEWQTHFSKGGRPIPTFPLVRNQDDLRTLIEKTGESTYPFGSVLMTGLGPNVDQAGLGQRFKSVVSGRSDNSDRFEISNNLPARVGLGLTFRTDQLDEVIALAHILMFAAPKIRLQITNDYGFLFNIALNIDPELSIPGADLGYPSKEFRFETSMFIETYVMRTSIQGPIREVRLQLIDSGGVTTLGDFPEINTIGETILRDTDILDSSSNYYKRD